MLIVQDTIKMAKLPKAPLREIMKEEGCTKVSAKGVITFREEVERYAYALANMSKACALHAGRTTINEADVKLAVR